MRTKSLLLAAALGVAGALSASAQSTNVYSVNAVGYVNAEYNPGFNQVSNPLIGTNNTIGALFPSLPNFSSLYKFNGVGYDIATFAFGSWNTPLVTLDPGEGAFLNISGSSKFTNTFVGNVAQGNLTNSLPTGYSLQASKVPQTSDVTVLGLTAALGNFDAVFKYNGVGYDIYTYAFGGWSPSTPIIDVGKSVFVQVAAPRIWTRTFSANN